MVDNEYFSEYCSAHCVPRVLWIVGSVAMQ